MIAWLCSVPSCIYAGRCGIFCCHGLRQLFDETRRRMCIISWMLKRLDGNCFLLAAVFTLSFHAAFCLHSDRYAFMWYQRFITTPKFWGCRLLRHFSSCLMDHSWSCSELAGTLLLRWRCDGCGYQVQAFFFGVCFHHWCGPWLWVSLFVRNSAGTAPRASLRWHSEGFAGVNVLNSLW